VLCNSGHDFRASCSSVPLHPASVDVREGFDYLQSFLLQNQETGIAASPFSVTVKSDIEKLHHLVSLHGILPHGMSADECRVLLWRHVFSGHCVTEHCSSLDRTACFTFAKGFQSAREMSFAAFSILASAKVTQRSNEDLLHLLQDLEVKSVFRPQNLRCQITRQLSRQAKVFQSSITGSDEFFVAFERHSRASLLAVASAHGLNVQRYTGTNNDLKESIMAHFASGHCFKNSQSHATIQSPMSEACRSTFQSTQTKSDVTSRTEFLLSWLDLHKNGLSRIPLQRLLRALKIDHGPDDNLRQLRAHLRKYITTLRRNVLTLQNDERAEADRAANQQRLAEMHHQWPSLVSQSLKDKIITMFRQQTCSQTLKAVTCASCAESCLSSDCCQVNLHDIDVGVLRRPDFRMQKNSDHCMIVDPHWLNSDVVSPILPSPIQSMPDIMLDGAGVHTINADTSHSKSGDIFLTLCKTCKSSIKSGHVPPLSLANHMVLGDVPAELNDLTVVEEAMIAKCRAKCWIMQLKEEGSDSRSSPNAQRSIKGHVIIYPQRPSAISEILPPPLDEVSTPICVVFVGSSPPTDEWLRTKAKPLTVRREKVRNALIWLKAHNPLYKDITINNDLLNNLPDDYMLPVHIEHVLPNTARDSLTSRYDNLQPPFHKSHSNSDVDENSTERSVPFQNVVITDVDGSAPANELRAAAIRHIKKKGGGYIEINHDPVPINEFFNPEMFPMIYPTLFPYGIGGFENCNRSARVSLKRHTKHMFSLADRRFQEHYSFLFTIFNILQRREILLHTSLKVKRKKFTSVAHSLASVSAESVHIVSERVGRGDWKTYHSQEEKQVLNLMKEVNVLTSHVPGSAAARVAMRNEIRALMMEKGLPSFYVTINPADIYNPLVKFLAGADIDIDNLLPEQVPDYWEQSLLVAKNPAVAAKFFDTYMRAFISTILGHDTNAQNLEGGIFGIVNAYYGCVEAQGRGTLHCHMLIWVEGSLNPNEIKDRVLKDGDVEFRDRLLAFLDDTIANSIPPDLSPVDVQENTASLPHPCAVRGVDLADTAQSEAETSSKKIERQKDLHRLIKQCQLHVHSQTCYKYWKGPLSGEPRECRFDLDEANTCPESSFDSETGELNLRCLDGLVNNFNLTIIEAIRCNMDVKFIGSGASAKAVLYYITDYITKSQLKSHIAFAALELAVKKLGEQNKREDETTIRAKRLLQKCAYAMISHQELSAQQVCSYLLEFGDHYTSHEFRNLYWTAFERFIEEEDPSPECHSRQPSDADTDTSTPEDTFPDELQNEIMNDVEDSEQRDTNVENNPDSDVADLEEDEVVILVQPNGELLAKTSQVLDYQQRSSFLSHLCLWDTTAQVDKVRKKQKQYDNHEEADDSQDNSMDTDVQDTSGYPNSNEILSSTSRIRPTGKFNANHPDSHTHMQRVRHPQNRFVPVPIGPSLPRRDRDQIRERYCCLMLIIFKPWRHARDLRETTESWSSAFQSFMETCSPQKQKIMDNMQILHECKDSRDDHFVQRRNRNRNRANCEITRTRESDDDDFSGDRDCEELILDHLMSIDDSQSARIDRARENVLTCLKFADESGLFNSPCNEMSTDNDSDGQNQVTEENLTLEDIWKAEYEEHRLEWKKRTCTNPSQIEDPNITNAQPILNDGSVFRKNNLTEQTSQPLEPHMCHIPPSTQIIDPQPMLAIEQLVQKFTLNREQARAFRIVAEHSTKEKPSPLRMFIGGPGGTGKSRVITALKEFFDQQNQCRRFRLSSYTGVAAKNISGMTLHAALSLNQRKKKGISGKSRRDLIAMWEGVDYLFVDEVSMIGCKLLLKISEALSDAKQSQLPFGGMNIILAGDFAQLPPVGESRLFSHINIHDAKNMRGQQNVFGKLLWLSVNTVVLLTEVMRQHGSRNLEFVSLLDRLRVGRCTNTDFHLLNCKQLTKSDFTNPNEDWNSVPIIVSNNECKDALNIKATADFATKTGRPMHWYYALDTRGGKEIQDERLHQHLETMHSGKTNQRLKRIPLVIGMPVIICQNFDVEHGVVNGCTGTLKRIRYRTDQNGNRHALSCIVGAPTTSGTPLHGLERQSVAVLRDTTEMRFIHPFSHKTCTIKRTQVPIMPAFAMTAHKAQGQTMISAIVDLESCVGTESPYVMVSRVKSLDGLRILRPFNIAKIQCHQSEDSRREFRRLELLRLLTIVEFGTTSERAEAQEALSKTNYRDQTGPENRDGTHESCTVDSARRLDGLQRTNLFLTSTPCPHVSLKEKSATTPVDPGENCGDEQHHGVSNARSRNMLLNRKI
jgi:hypothetical protein